MQSFRNVHVRARTVKNFALNKTQWGGEEWHLECPLGLALATRWVWILFAVNGATEGKREEGIKQHVSQFLKYFYVHDLFSQSGREEVYSQFIGSFVFHHKRHLSQRYMIWECLWAYTGPKKHTCPKSVLYRHTQAHCTVLCRSHFLLLFLFVCFAFILTWFRLMHSFCVLSIYASDSKSFWNKMLYSQ